MAKTVEILMVEDNPGDVRLTQEMFKEMRLKNKLHIVEDGVEALEWLYRRGRHTDAVRPDMILLDLNLPNKDGREVLAEIKADEHLKRIPVVVLTTSAAEKDIFKAYDLHANCYITKPINIDQFMQVIRAIENFWLAIVSLPPGEDE